MLILFIKGGFLLWPTERIETLFSSAVLSIIE